MKQTNTFREHFGIRTRHVEFIDIPMDEDLLAFICPFLIANNRQDPRIDTIYGQMESFLKYLNRNFIMTNDKVNGMKFLSHLHEPNEYHLGYSDSNKGKAMAKERSKSVFDSLRRNRFAQQGLSITNEAHNVLLLVEGIGQDIMSDVISNVCRNVFAQFTEEQCIKHSIQTYPTQIEYYNDNTGQWATTTYNLPEYKGKRIILIPNEIVAGHRMYSTYYNWFVSSNYIAVDLMKKSKTDDDANDKTMRLLKDGSKKAVIKEIYRVYRKPKHDLIDFVLKYRGSLDEFLVYAKEHYPALDLDNLDI
ncbi:hypothetical protein HUK80_06175 [Flavobacterium sp. MAH-1]|uniref:Uncharacterized protein n=1 Tax=Flavobacterium agri TaxID=2743471 RepID=A0A7Y9C4R5_9FLAO|nr:hypothetical protein [Flavobacterium agri]NUY80476.1 hypothetical protein [Flavobacterium agri]NYA70501.1 hypothetical protein [Flavobacterium agri]